MKSKLVWAASAVVAIALAVALASVLGQFGGGKSVGAAPSELNGVNGAGVAFTCYLLDDSGTEPSYACPSASWYVDPRTADPGGGDPPCWANNRPSKDDAGPHPCQLLIDDSATALNLSAPGVLEKPSIGNRALLAPSNLKSDDPIFSGGSCWVGIRTYFGTTYSSRPVVLLIGQLGDRRRGTLRVQQRIKDYSPGNHVLLRLQTLRQRQRLLGIRLAGNNPLTMIYRRQNQ